MTIMLTLLLIISIVFIQDSYAQTSFSQQLFKNLAQNKNPIPKIDIPDYKRVELDNGLVVYLVKDDQLPLVELTGYIKGGNKQERREIAGISSLMLEMMNTGTDNFNEQELAKYKELHSIDLNFKSRKDYFKFSGNSLSKDQKELIRVLADILQNPNFKAQYFKRIKRETLRGLAQARTQERALLNMYFYKHIYQDHPYSFDYNLNLRRKALANITPKTLNKFYKQTIAPNNIVLGIVGDIDLTQMENLIKKTFSKWSAKELNLRKPEIKRDTDDGEVILVNKPDATQARIKMGYNFFDYKFKDRVPFKIANRVYGGGSFSSRLMENLRTEKGYVYGIHAKSSYQQLGGVYYVATEAKPSKIDEVIQGIKREMITIKQGEQEITEEELFEVVNLYNALFPKSYQSKLKVLNEVMYNVELRNREVDYMNQFIEKYNTLDQSEVQQVFAQYSRPDQFLTVIVGNKKDILPQFKEQEIDVKVIEID
ncbi:pitrilysin family protein [Halanaerocella petrolearia]